MTPFRLNAHDELTIAGVTYCVAEHPAAPSFPYGQAGRVVCTPFGGDREKEYYERQDERKQKAIHVSSRKKQCDSASAETPPSGQRLGLVREDR